MNKQINWIRKVGGVFKVQYTHLIGSNLTAALVHETTTFETFEELIEFLRVELGE